MAYKDVNLGRLRTEVNEKVWDFLREYYKKSINTPYLKQATLNFMENCRYNKDDIRPILVRLGYEVTGGKDPKYVLPAMASIHSLLLGFMPVDDIIDGATKQNFKNPQEFAEKLALAYSLSTKLKESGRNILRKYYGSLDNWLRIDELLSDCSERLDGSHTLEVNFHSKKPLIDYTINDYIDLIDEATSIFIATPFVMGGLINGVDKQREKMMWGFGMELGRLCQIRDDFLDYINPKVSGKIPFADLSEKRKRFPLLIAYKVGNKTNKQKIEDILSKESVSQRAVLSVIGMITSEKVKAESRKIIDETHRKAIKNLRQLPKNQPAYQSLEKITNLFAMNSN